MDQLIQTIVIVGGGTAGWLTAGVIAAQHQTRIAAGELNITLCESPNTPIIGVGEGTWPTMRTTLRKMGIAETDFIRQCDVSFKQGSKFSGWNNGSKEDYYHHPFSVPQGHIEVDLAEFWLKNNNAGVSFSALFHPQETICEAGLAPKTISTAEYDSVVNYGYHLNAGKFAPFLQKHCCEKLGVHRILADVNRVLLTASGHIESLETTQAGRIAGDLFIDCTGFKSLLLGETLGVDFIPVNDILFANCALATQVTYPQDDTPIATTTLSTAQTAGWIWDIGLLNRRGIGHVFSKDYISTDQASQQLLDYIQTSGGDAQQANIREIPFTAGYRKEFWRKNCVAVGLSAGFLEPLEASALVMVELSAMMIAEQLPKTQTAMPIVAKRFNERFSYRWHRAIDFLKLHYVLSQRNDSHFWQDNRRPESIPIDLRERLTLWQHKTPQHYDFDRTGEIFQSISYQYILYGMNFKTKVLFDSSQSVINNATDIGHRTQHTTQQLLQHLPAHRDLLKKIHQYGLSSI